MFFSHNSWVYTSAKLEEIDAILSKEFITPNALETQKDEMLENAIAGYVKGLDDPYTMYLTKPKNEILHNTLTDQTGVEWIGVYLKKEENTDFVTISEVIKNGPAYEAWLQHWDRIYVVDDVVLSDLTLSEVIELIRGEKWTSVHLNIQRTNVTWNAEFSVTIPRKSINIPSVTAELQDIDGKKVWIFVISAISEHTTQVFIEECLRFVQSGMQGIILDLRGNWGWYLEEASKFLWHFIDKWEVTVKTKYYAFSDNEFVSKWLGELKSFPIVILIDQLTASASEIIALALQEQGAIIVGMNSYWKWTIQSVQEFVDGSSLKYTVWEWFSPQGTSVTGTGILPDKLVEFDVDAYMNDGIDSQMEEAKKTLATLLENH